VEPRRPIERLAAFPEVRFDSPPDREAIAAAGADIVLGGVRARQLRERSRLKWVGSPPRAWGVVLEMVRAR
jgi:hypothetical protein